MEKLQVCLSKLELPLASVNRQFAPVGTTLKECQKVIFQFCIYLIRNNSNMLSGGLLFKKKSYQQASSSGIKKFNCKPVLYLLYGDSAVPYMENK